MATSSGWGGSRPNAGRKPTREKYASKIAAAEKKIADRLPALIDNLLELADGVTIKEVDKEGEERIYTRAPDFKANEYLINRILGKPLQHIEQEQIGEVNTTQTVIVQYDDIDPAAPPRSAAPDSA